jgi:acyl phosphate:glycerol-3-phosphate acyltransferase
MTVLFIITALIISYLIGSIPTAVWYGQAVHQLDVRNFGSGNAGATNTFRVLGKKAGSIVMAIDILKGFIASSFPLLAGYFGIDWSEAKEVQVQVFCGIGAVIGHILPLYANFKGGKGVATLLGMILAINIWASLACIGVFLIVFFISKYVSLGSMLAGLAFPLFLLTPRFYQYSPSKFLVAFGFVLFALLVFTHRKNIKRILAGQESKANLKFNKNR